MDERTERPILFSGAMVRALLAGTKTQTRRVAPITDLNIKPMSDDIVTWGVSFSKPVKDVLGSYSGGKFSDDQARRIIASQFCPYGQPGDRLWVREKWQYADWTEDGEPWIAYAAGGEDLLCRPFDEEWNKRLGDIWADLSHPDNYGIDSRAADRRWRPSIHMPRWASRITLEVTEVRVERLQDISEADAIAEGVERTVTDDGWRRYADAAFEVAGLTPCATARASYCSLWEQINGPGSWDANPWVWVVGVRRAAAAIGSDISKGEKT